MTSRSHLAALVASALFLACSRDGGDSPSSSTESAAGSAVDTSMSAEEDRPDPSATAAQALLRALADRDEALIAMGRLAITRREQLDVSSDARRLLTERRRESNRLLGALRGEYRVTYQPKIPAQLQQNLDSLNGVGMGEFDGAFLRIVARQYEDDARLIERELPNITVARLREVLEEIRVQRTGDAAAFRKRIAAR